MTPAAFWLATLAFLLGIGAGVVVFGFVRPKMLRRRYAREDLRRVQHATAVNPRLQPTPKVFHLNLGQRQAPCGVWWSDQQGATDVTRDPRKVNCPECVVSEKFTAWEKRYWEFSDFARLGLT